MIISTRRRIAIVFSLIGVYCAVAVPVCVASRDWAACLVVAMVGLFAVVVTTAAVVHRGGGGDR